MSDDNPRRTFMARRSHGVPEVRVLPIITKERRLEAWERPVENIELLMRKDGDV